MNELWPMGDSSQDDLMNGQAWVESWRLDEWSIQDF